MAQDNSSSSNAAQRRRKVGHLVKELMMPLGQPILLFSSLTETEFPINMLLGFAIEPSVYIGREIRISEQHL